MGVRLKLPALGLTPCLTPCLALCLSLGVVTPLACAQSVGAAVAGSADNASAESLLAQARSQSTALLNTLRDLVSIESGSRDLEGLRAIADVVARRLEASGLQVQVIPTRASATHPQLKGAELGPMVYARLAGKGQKKVLLIAHMDTVYSKGMSAQQPFRVEGDKAYGLGVSDDKAGVALILHTVDLLKQNGFTDYAELGVLINGDEEIGSPGSRTMLTELGSQYDAVLSFEGGGFRTDAVRLATSSIAIAELRVKGKASHAGANPEAGRNAIYELSHQILKTRQLGDASKGLKINWTVIEGGGTRNVIPASAYAVADVRSDRNSDLDLMERALRESLESKLIADTQHELSFYRSRPALVSTSASLALAQHAQDAFREIGLKLEVRDKPTGGGTDAAFAALKARGGVVEGFGLRGYGAHSNDNEYIFLDSIAPRLYLSVRMVMDIGSGRLSGPQ